MLKVVYLDSYSVSDDEPKPKPRPIPGYGLSRERRSITPPRDEIPQLIPAEDACEVIDPIHLQERSVILCILAAMLEYKDLCKIVLVNTK